MTRRTGLLIALMVLASGCSQSTERIVFRNAHPSSEIGLLLDGKLDEGSVNDRAIVAPPDRALTTRVKRGPHNEIAAFQERRPMALLPDVRWDDSSEVAVTFGDERSVVVLVWLLQGPAEERRAQALAAAVTTDEIWRRERMGIRVGGFEIADRTADPAGSAFLDFTCLRSNDLRTRIGHDRRGVNVYYVDRVDFGSGFGTGNGVWCGGNTVVMGHNASSALVAHELGHAFALEHVNSLASNFDKTNVMHSASNVREFLTEGQVFRAHAEPDSVANTTYGLRPGQPTRTCERLAENATQDCPMLHKRIWADGASFPPS